jgi:hypothetical protein
MQGYGPSPAGDAELIDPSLLVVAALDPQLDFQVRGDITEFQQVFTRASRGEDEPIFIITRVDRVKLGFFTQDSDSDLGFIV